MYIHSEIFFELFELYAKEKANFFLLNQVTFYQGQISNKY